MPYIVVKTNHLETDRRELSGMVVFGRAPECDVTVRDISLSRRHCRIEESPDGWTIIDLGSKNGTAVNGDQLNGAPRLLSDGDIVRLGQSKIVFYEGIPNEDICQRLMAPGRPVDPHEALAGTVSGFTLLPAGEAEVYADMPQPQPAPKVPASLEGEELRELLVAIASSSWDSIYAEARQPALMRPMPAAREDRPRRRVARPRSPIDLSLQAPTSSSIAEADPENDVLSISETAALAAPEPRDTPRPGQEIRTKRWKRWVPRSRASMQRHLRLAAIAIWLVAFGILIHQRNWLMPNLSPAQATGASIKRPLRIINDQPAATASEKTAPTTQADQSPAEPVYLDLPSFQETLPSLLRTPEQDEPDANPTDDAFRIM